MKIAFDKLVHFLVCTLIAVVLCGIFSKGCAMGHDVTIGAAFGITFAIGIGKEWYDKNWKGGAFSLADLLADFLGAIAGVIVSAIIFL